LDCYQIAVINWIGDFQIARYFPSCPISAVRAGDAGLHNQSCPISAVKAGNVAFLNFFWQNLGKI